MRTLRYYSRAGMLLALLAPAALAQIQLFLFEQGQERPAGSQVDAGQVAPGDSRTLRFRVRNSGSAAVTIQVITLAGAGFRLGNRPSLPYVLAPTNFVEFEAVFQPTAPGNYSATAAVNGMSLLLRGSSAPAALVMADRDGRLVTLSTSDLLDFGRVQRGTSAVRAIVLSNAHTAALAVSNLRVEGAAYRLAGSPNLPLTLAPGESRRFEIVFEPRLSGSFAGKLAVDERQFPLSGAAIDPPLPALTLQLDNPAPASGQQRRASVRLASPSPVEAAGNLRIEFRSDIAGVADDPAVRFAATGSRSASFTIREGDTQARFGADWDVAIQTGTTAGKLLMTLELGPANLHQPPDLVIAIPRAAAAIETASFTRRLSDLDVTLNGFDNTYEAGLMAFTFYDSAGRAVEPGVIRVDARPEFETFYRSARTGSAFFLRASFPVIGDASGIVGVEVEMTNAAGSTRTARIPLR